MYVGETNTSERSLTLDEIAFRIMKTPGYIAVTAEEIIHLIKCILYIFIHACNYQNRWAQNLGHTNITLFVARYAALQN